MNELDVIRLMMAIGVLLLMAASAALGMLWQRQQNLVATLQAALGTQQLPLHVAGNTAGMNLASMTNTAAPATAPCLNEARSLESGFTDERISLRGHASAPSQAIESGRQQTVSGFMRSTAGSGDIRTGTGGMNIDAPFGARQPAQPAAAPMSEEERLRALLAGKSVAGKSVTGGSGLSRNGSAREPRLW